MLAGLKSRLLRMRTSLHRAVFARSNGRLLATWGRLPVLMVTTIGRRTGLPRTTVLAALLTLDETIVVVASDGGAALHPQWYLNLCDDPIVEVVFRGRRRRMRARTAAEEEKALLWPRITAASPSYARYQADTARNIPVVLLEPDGRDADDRG